MPHKAIVIEITAATFTALEITGGPGSPEISRWVTERLPAEGLSAAFIKKLWRQRKFSITRVIWILPETVVRYKTLPFMVLPEGQLTAAVKVELESSAGGQDIWRVIGRQQQGGQINVRVALIADPQLRQSMDILNQAGLEVLWSGFSSRGLQNYIFFHQDLWETETAQFAYLNVTETQTEYGVVTEDNLCYRRDLELGNRDLIGADSSAAQTDLLEELRLSLASSKTTGQQQTDRLWLFGSNAAVLVNLKKGLAQAGLTVILPEKTNLSGVTPQNQIPRLAPLIGLALDELGWNAQKNLRIYTLAQQQQELVQGKIQWVLKLALVGCFLLLGGWLLAQATLTENQKQQQWLRSQTAKLTKLQQVEAKTRTNLQKIGRLEQWAHCQGRELELLLALQDRLPAGTVITDLTIEEGKAKNIAGTTPSVSLLLTELGADPVLQGLQLKGNIMTTENGLEGFQLEGQTELKEPKTK
jgi:Tfp pilus assembly protein PilN